MPRALVILVAVSLALLALAPACSNGSGSGNGAACPAGFDASGPLGGTVAVSQQGQCGSLLTGTKQNGAPCQQSSDCAPTCCACPGNGRSAQVALCNKGTCLVGADVCCVWIDENVGPDGGGAPYLCTR